MATGTKYFDSGRIKRFVSQKSVGYTIVAGYLLFVMAHTAELKDGTTATVYQIDGLGDIRYLAECPTIDRPTRIGNNA